VDAGDPETEEWRYYHRDGNNLARQTTNSQAEITLAWAYSPDGAVLIGAKGQVTNLGCGDIYDWSTGLVYKNGRYFDPNLGIWLTLAPFVVWQKYKLGKRGGKIDQPFLQTEGSNNCALSANMLQWFCQQALRGKSQPQALSARGQCLRH
jgi:hypothetical protein